MKILIFATHPIQYQVPIYRKLSQYVDLKVIYLLKQTKEGQAKAGFGVEFEWDIPLTDGYNFEYLTNKSSSPSSSDYNGIILSNAEINHLFKREKPDAVIIHGWFPKGMKQIINHSKKNDIPSFCRGDSTLLMTDNPVKKIIKEIYIRNILRKINYFLYVGKENKKYYRHYGVQENRLLPAYHCINTPFFKDSFNISTSPSNDKITIGFAGKFIDKKQPLLIINAIKNSSFLSEVELFYIGDGPLRKDLETEAKRNKIKLRITGFLNQSEIVDKGYKNLDLLILPSKHNETWGLVVNEVMTGGIPCIVSNKVGCHSDLIIDGKTGYTFEANSSNDLTNKIDAFIKAKINGYNFKENVLKVIEKYSLENTVKGYLKALNQIENK